jgi:hypothetical protein
MISVTRPAWICSSSSATSSSSSSASSTETLPPSISSIVPASLPIIETFDAFDAIGFFSPGYKILNTPYLRWLEDDYGSGFLFIDHHPSFYYPGAAFWEIDSGTGEYTGSYVSDLDYWWQFGEGKLAMAGGRFTIGQTMTDQIHEEALDPKVNTTGDTSYAGSWGELDLSQPYRVSYCVNDAGVAERSDNGKAFEFRGQVLVYGAHPRGEHCPGLLVELDAVIAVSEGFGDHAGRP